jgi:hypothetical protein
MRKLMMFFAALAMSTTLVGVSAGPASAAAKAAPALSCQTYYICFYNQNNYGGSRCAWEGDDPDWRAGSITCSWSSTQAVRSAYNQGHSGAAVRVYSGANYTGSSICIIQYAEERYLNFRGRSHRWGGC